MESKKPNQHGGARPGSGRKPSPADAKRSMCVCVKFTQREHDLVLKAAGDMPKSVFVRESAIEKAKKELAEAGRGKGD